MRGRPPKARPCDARRAELVELMRRGMSDADVLARLLAGKTHATSQAYWADYHNLAQQVALARAEVDYEREGGPIRRKGPWPVSYVRNTGEVVYRVGAGHDVPEGSLKALGFEK